MFRDIGLTSPLELTKHPHTWHWSRANVQKLLPYMCAQSVAFRTLVQRAVGSVPAGQPLRLALYYDEVTPGNALALDNARKLWSFYIRFLEFGHIALRYEESWLPLAVLRTSKCKVIRGGFTRCVRQILHDLRIAFSVGVLVELEGGPRLVFASVTNNLADEAALKRGLDSKGSAGLFPCLVCRNVTLLRSGLAEADTSSYLATTACADHGKFHSRTDDDIFRTVDNLIANKMIARWVSC